MRTQANQPISITGLKKILKEHVTAKKNFTFFEEVLKMLNSF